MAKTKKTDEPGKDAGIDPCWSRYPDRDASYCDLAIWIGGAGFSANAEFTAKEEHETKDLSALKKERIRKGLELLDMKVLEYLNG